MIQPALQGDALLADIEEAAAQDTDDLFLWWLGQSGLLTTWRGTRLLFDPYLSDSLTRKYADTDKPHVRMTELCVEPGALTSISLLTSSHNHTDHLDAETLLPLQAANPDATLVIPEANRAFVADRLGCEVGAPTGCDDGMTLSVGDVQVTGIAAAHEEVDRDDAGRCHFLGFVAKLGPWTIYHSGDTMLYDGMVERLAPHGIDVALLPINGRKPERRVAGNLFGDQAAQLAADAGMGTVLPCHYEMFEFNTESPQLFVDTCEQLGVDYRVPRCGEQVRLV